MTATWDGFERLRLTVGVITDVEDFPKRVAGFKSEVSVLGAYSDGHRVVLLQPDRDIEPGSSIGERLQVAVVADEALRDVE